MSKAEDRAKERYWLEPTNIETQKKYAAYIEGYHQAEKDLELTVEDIVHIIETYNELEFSREFTTVTFNDTCKEVLKRFKDLKNGTTKR